MPKTKLPINPVVFIISGLLMMALILGIKYAVGAEAGFISLLVTFLYGGLVGHMIFSKHKSFIKDIVIFSAVLFVLWTIFQPISTVGNSLIFKRVEMAALGLIFFMFLDYEVRGVFKHKPKKWVKYFPGFIAIIAFMIFAPTLGITKAMGEFFTKYWYIMVGLLLVFWYFLFKGIAKGSKTAGSKIIGFLEKK